MGFKVGSVIESKLPILMKEAKIKNYTELSLLSGIEINKIHGFSEGHISFKVADELCNFFECKIDTLLNTVPNKPVDYSHLIDYKDNRNGIVYFLAADNGLIKIGRTANFLQRQKTIEMTDKVKTELINYIATFDTPELELTFHKLFSEKRIKGEWFDLNESDLKLIKSL
jgi:DNA-binding Xre family transcriptional regulator